MSDDMPLDQRDLADDDDLTELARAMGVLR